MNDEKETPFEGYEKYAKNFERHTFKEIIECEGLYQWSEPGTSIFGVQIFFRPYYVILFGDIGPAVYHHSDKDSFHWARTCPNFHYVSSKLEGQHKEYDPENTAQMITEALKEKYAEEKGDETDPASWGLDHPFYNTYNSVKRLSDILKEADYNDLPSIFELNEIPFDSEMISYSWERNEVAKICYAALRTFLDAYGKKKKEEEAADEAAHPGLYIVRLWDGMDGEWMDITKPLPYSEAKAIWLEKTKGGKEKVRYDEIDYFRIFEADTKMMFTMENPLRI